MTARVLVVGLDAAEATLLERWADAGRLPALAALRRRGVAVALTGPMKTLPGAIWPELQLGRSAGRVGQYYHPWQLHTGEDVVRPIAPDEIDAEGYYWAVAAQHGCRVCVVDQPQSVLAQPQPGLVQLAEWGTHDRNYVTASDPPTVLEEVQASVGAHPVARCDDYGAADVDRMRLLADLQRGLAAKGALLLDLLGRADWDLFTTVLTESHCVGHQTWELMAQGPSAPPELAGAIADVYQRMDHLVGQLIEHAGEGANVIVYASHGMGPAVGGPQLVHEVMFRLGLVRGGRARRALPPGARAWLRRRLPAVTGPVSRGTGLRSAGTRAVAVDNNRCAAIRVNLVGREPHGTVRPGPEAEQLLAWLRDQLYALRQPGTGEPIVARVQTATEAFGPGHHPDVPDLLVSFRTDLGALTACESPAVGRVRARFAPGSTRTGDHTARSMLWAAGPAAPAAGTGRGSVLDLAPTVLSLLGVPLPAGLDGQPLWSLQAG